MSMSRCSDCGDLNHGSECTRCTSMMKAFNMTFAETEITFSQFLDWVQSVAKRQADEVMADHTRSDY